ncbi:MULTISPECIES: elongation factor G [unclassified Pyramidobacter]|uniref:elongation factor G n=1 Tax=unclassified Pyramidobacter TaxID=2632171 RepID=UPI00098E926E|nr:MULTISPECIES: elongation factor G [unclassified Pyramidobacter]OON88171.1 translation elongation factor G [Pyramidobacter sp. C12-8]RKJ79106.1 elongation factor G [Pyramidobacter sp. CG50-2]
MGMKTEDIRSIAIVAHGSAGKTSLAEALLFDAGVTTRRGSVENGNTVSDYTAEEQKRQISISTSLLNYDYKGKKVFVLDVPGYADFIGDLRSSLRVAGSAVMLVSAVDGVEVQTEKAWEFAREFETSTIFFVNKMDRENADYNGVYEQIRANLSKGAYRFMLPIGSEASFKGVVDVLKDIAYVYNDDSGKFEEQGIPEEMISDAHRARGYLVEAIVEEDEEMMMRYLDGEDIPIDELLPVLQRCIYKCKIFPVMPGSALKNIGVRQLMDLIVDYLPSPLEMRERPAVKGGEKEITIKPDDDATFSGLCFKVLVDPYVGKLSYVRVNSGKLTTDEPIFNVSTGQEERVSTFKIMQGKESVDVKEVTTGMIVAIPKLQSTRAGDTMGKAGSTVLYPAIKFPRPVYSVAVDPESRADEDKLGTAVRRITEEDPTVSFEKNAETNDNILSGMGNLHLDIVLAKLKDRFGVNLKTRVPQVAYRETIRKSAKAQGKHKKQTGGHGQYGDVYIEFSPLERGEGFVFEDKITGGTVPRQYIPAVEKGLRECLNKGVLAAFPTVDFKASLYFGSYHDVDSSEMAFKTAAHLAFKKGMAEASPILLEPIMDVKVIVPDQYLGEIMGDFNTRRGRIMGVDTLGHLQVVNAQVPQAEMFQYAINLRSMTSGRGTYEMAFSHYDPVPEEITKKIVSERQGLLTEEEE